MISNKLNRHPFITAIAAGALVSCLPDWTGLSSTAVAQVVQVASTTSSPRGSISSRDLDLIARTVNLDEGQREIVDSLHDGYMEQFRTHSKAHHDAVQELYKNNETPEQWEQAIKTVNTKQEEFKANNERLTEEFLASVRDILSQPQLDLWPRVERDRRRDQHLARYSRFSGEAVDLIAIVDKLKVDSEIRREIDPVLNTYADELDSAIQSRLTAAQRWEDTIHSDSDTPADPQVIADLRKRLDQRRKTVRDVNFRYAEIIPTQLPPDLAKEFSQAFKQAAYRRIYRPTAADKFIDRAIGLADITTEQQSAIRMIELDYDMQVEVINAELARLQRESEESQESGGPFSFGNFEFAHGDDGAFGSGGVVLGDAQGSSWVVAQRIELDAGSVEDVEVMDMGLHLTLEDPGHMETPIVFSTGRAAPDPDSPEGKLLAQKQQLIERTIKSVWSVLNPDQQALLPLPTEHEMMSPEDRARARMKKAMENAVITHSDDGNVSIEVRVEDEGESDN